MPSDVEVDHARRAVVVTVIGAFSAQDVASFVSRAREHAVANDYGMLYDMSAATPGDISLADLFWMPRTMPALANVEAKRRRAALVHPPADIEFARFWETTFGNSGFQVRAFTEREAAFRWLAEGPGT